MLVYNEIKYACKINKIILSISFHDSQQFLTLSAPNMEKNRNKWLHIGLFLKHEIIAKIYKVVFFVSTDAN